QPGMGDAERKRICRIIDTETGRTAEVEGLIYRLIVRLHRYSLGQNNYFDSRHWKTGMILDDGVNGRAFLEEIAGEIHVTVRAAYPDGFLGNLCSEIEWLVDYFWKGLDCRRSVACHPPCKGLHEVKALVETKREGIPKVRCNVCEKFHDIDSLLLAATAKFPLEVVLAELKKVRTELAEVKDGVSGLNTDVRAMIAQANEQFELFLKALTDPAKDGPRLFSFEPVETGFWDKPKWISQKFRLTLWCEHSRLPLPMLTGDKKLGVYEIELTRDWMRQSAPFLKVLCGTLSLALPIAVPAVAAKLAIDAASIEAFQDQVDTGKAFAESLLDAGQKVGDWLSTDDAAELDSGHAMLAQGAMLRELHALLKQKDKTGRFGGLERVQNKRREFLWVHPQFKNEY
ncbi:MAG: hypothetical protein KDA66_09540, partial [Planctomycetaceae bacterium]|nr:hypothetical protein [Planctomycetaceae bacterium]